MLSATEISFVLARPSNRIPRLTQTREEISTLICGKELLLSIRLPRFDFYISTCYISTEACNKPPTSHQLLMRRNPDPVRARDFFRLEVSILPRIQMTFNQIKNNSLDLLFNSSKLYIALARKI